MANADHPRINDFETVEILLRGLVLGLPKKQRETFERYIRYELTVNSPKEPDALKKFLETTTR